MDIWFFHHDSFGWIDGPARRDPHTVAYPVARVQQHLITARKSREDFGDTGVAVPNLDDGGVRASIAKRENRPVIALPKQGAERHGKRIVGLPDSHVDDNPEVVSKPRPDFRRVDQIDCNADPLLLYP